MDVTIPGALEISLLGMIVVFIVLVFLMGITYVLAAIFKPKTGAKKTALVEGSALHGATAGGLTSTVNDAKTETPPASGASAEQTHAALQTPAADSVAVQTAPPGTSYTESIAAAPAQRQFRVIINGTEQIIDAEISESATAAAQPQNGAQAQASGETGSAGEEQAVPESQAVQSGAASIAGAENYRSVNNAKRQYNVIINGVGHTVDAEITESSGGVTE